MPSSRQVRITRTAISPRLAMRTFSSTLGLSSVRRALTIARPVWCLPCGAGSGTSAGSTRSTRPTPTSVTEARQGAAGGPRRGGRPPDGRPGPPRPPLGVAAGGEPAGLRPAPPGMRRGRPPPVHGGGGAGRRRRLPRRRRRRAVAQMAQRPAGRRRRSWPASWPRPTSPERARGAAVVVGIGINVAWPGPPGRRGHLPGRRSAARRSRSTGRTLLERLLDALSARRPLLDDAGGRRALADEVRRRCATLGPAVRVSWPAEELIGAGQRHRRRRPARRRDGRRARGR